MARAMARAKARAKERMPGFAESARFDLFSATNHTYIYIYIKMISISASIIHAYLCIYIYTHTYIFMDLLSWLFDEFSSLPNQVHSTHQCLGSRGDGKSKDEIRRLKAIDNSMKGEDPDLGQNWPPGLRFCHIPMGWCFNHGKSGENLPVIFFKHQHIGLRMNMWYHNEWFIVVYHCFTMFPIVKMVINPEILISDNCRYIRISCV